MTNNKKSWTKLRSSAQGAAPYHAPGFTDHGAADELSTSGLASGRLNGCASAPGNPRKRALE
jgi:hypothetical protein